MSALPSDVSAMRTSVISTEALGSRAARFGAVFIDGILVGVLAAIIGVLAHSAAAYYVVASLGTLAYNLLLLSRPGEHNGQTLGKQWLSLRVVSTSGAPVTLAIAAKREVLGRWLLSAVTIGLYGLIDALWCLWDARKQTLHDKIGGTYVFKAIVDPAQAPQLTLPGPPVFASAPATPPPPPPPPPPSIGI
jgi:uncharacterized RDD family membrane protein YckC